MNTSKQILHFPAETLSGDIQKLDKILCEHIVDTYVGLFRAFVTRKYGLLAKNFGYFSETG